MSIYLAAVRAHLFLHIGSLIFLCVLQLKVKDDHFLELGLAFLAVDALGAGDMPDVKALVELEHFRVVIVGKDESALDTL